MSSKKTNIDSKRYDSRIVSLTLTIDGLKKAILELEEKVDEIECYDGLWFLEEAEPIVGLAFIAFQNYINSSIFDRYETLNSQYEKYKIGKLIENSNRFEIELIVGIANYFKHRDDPNDLRKSTASILKDCHLKFNKEIDITNSPIFEGLNYFCKSRDLMKVIHVVANWREKLWTD